MNIKEIPKNHEEVNKWMEEYISEINEKNRRMAQEIYDTVMEYRRHNGEMNSEEDTD